MLEKVQEATAVTVRYHLFIPLLKPSDGLFDFYRLVMPTLVSCCVTAAYLRQTVVEYEEYRRW